jgi:DtxR family Mn-dependent transcriptional regulator
MKILEKEEFDNSLRILIDERELQISQQIASNLYVKKIEL